MDEGPKGLEAFIQATIRDPKMSAKEKMCYISQYSRAARLAGEFASKHDVGYDPEDQTWEQLTHALVRFFLRKRIDLDLINWDGILPDDAE